MNGFVFANVPADPAARGDLPAVQAATRATSPPGCKLDGDPSRRGRGAACGRGAPGRPLVHPRGLFFCTGVGHQKGEAYSPQSYTEMGNAIGSALRVLHRAALAGAAARRAGAGGPRRPRARRARAPAERRRLRRRAARAVGLLDRETPRCRGAPRAAGPRAPRERDPRAAELTARCSARSLTAAAAAPAAPAAAGERPSCSSTGRARRPRWRRARPAAADWQLQGKRPPQQCIGLCDLYYVAHLYMDSPRTAPTLRCLALAARRSLSGRRRRGHCRRRRRNHWRVMDRHELAAATATAATATAARAAKASRLGRLCEHLNRLARQRSSSMRTTSGSSDSLHALTKGFEHAQIVFS